MCYFSDYKSPLFPESGLEYFPLPCLVLPSQVPVLQYDSSGEVKERLLRIPSKYFSFTLWTNPSERNFEGCSQQKARANGRGYLTSRNMTNTFLKRHSGMEKVKIGLTFPKGSTVSSWLTAPSFLELSFQEAQLVVKTFLCMWVLNGPV